MSSAIPTTTTLRDVAASLVLGPDLPTKIEILKTLLDAHPSDEKNSGSIVLWNVAQTYTDNPMLRSRCEDMCEFITSHLFFIPLLPFQ